MAPETMMVAVSINGYSTRTSNDGMTSLYWEFQYSLGEIESRCLRSRWLNLRGASSSSSSMSLMDCGDRQIGRSDVCSIGK